MAHHKSPKRKAATAFNDIYNRVRSTTKNIEKLHAAAATTHVRGKGDVVTHDLISDRPQNSPPHVDNL